MSPKEFIFEYTGPNKRSERAECKCKLHYFPHSIFFYYESYKGGVNFYHDPPLLNVIYV